MEIKNQKFSIQSYNKKGYHTAVTGTNLKNPGIIRVGVNEILREQDGKECSSPTRGRPFPLA